MTTVADVITAVTGLITAHPEIALLMVAGGVVGLAANFGRRLVRLAR